VLAGRAHGFQLWLKLRAIHPRAINATATSGQRPYLLIAQPLYILSPVQNTHDTHAIQTQAIKDDVLFDDQATKIHPDLVTYAPEFGILTQRVEPFTDKTEISGCLLYAEFPLGVIEYRFQVLISRHRKLIAHPNRYA
jgi:hypothetical protein